MSKPDQTSPTIRRYPPTKNNSLRAWSAADEHIIKWFKENVNTIENLLILNDRFGYLTSNLYLAGITTICDNKSNLKSAHKNLSRNQLDPDKVQFLNPLETPDQQFDNVCLIIPKSLELFRFYIQKIHSLSTEKSVVVCGFMTRHFSPKILEIAQYYFEDVNQSLAWKKSRALVLKGKKNIPADDSGLITFEDALPDGNIVKMKQYPGVFSQNRIDNATRFLLGNLNFRENEKTVLDLASGSGILAKAVQHHKPDAEIHLMDDSYMAVESSKLNLDERTAHFHWTDTLDDIDKSVSFDLVVSNPPFHLDHEVNTEIAIELFREVAGRLNKGGRFISVSNRHLGYKPFLKKFFTYCDELAANKKFIIYECRMNS